MRVREVGMVVVLEMGRGGLLGVRMMFMGVLDRVLRRNVDVVIW